MLDLIAITILILFFIRGYMKGLIVAVFSVLAIIIGVIAALKLSGLLADWLLEKGWASAGWVQLISYAILFIGVLLLVRLISAAIRATTKLVMLGWVDGLLGGLFYGFLGVFLWSSVLWLLNQMTLISEESKLQSKTIGYVQPVAPWVVDKAGYLLPFAKDLMGDLNLFFDEVAENKKDDVGTDR